MQPARKVKNIVDRFKTLGRSIRDRNRFEDTLEYDYKQVRLEQLTGKGTEANQARKMKSIQRRFVNATADTSWEEFQQAQESKLFTVPAQEALELKQAELSKPISDLNEQIKKKTAERDKSFEEYKKADDELGNLSALKQRDTLIRKDFLKHWDVSKMVRFFLNPTDDEFARERVEHVRGLPGYDEWEEHRSEVARISKQKAKEAQREKKKQHEYNKQFQDKALKIINGRLPIPKELSVSYNHLNLPPNVLADFLRRKYEQGEAKKNKQAVNE